MVALQVMLGMARTSASAFDCPDGTIAHSNRTRAAPCAGSAGTECPYACDDGFIAIGRHVCQKYTIPNGTIVIDSVFFGGMCAPLCPNSTAYCSGADDAPVRYNISSSSTTEGWCLQTMCYGSSDDALRAMATGAYAVWQIGRHNRTGIYIDHVDPSKPPAAQDWAIASPDGTGVGMVTECVAGALGLIDLSQAADNVRTSMRALAGRLPGFAIPRNRGGWLPTFINPETGKALSKDFSTDSTAFNTIAALWAANFFESNVPNGPGGDAVVAEIRYLAQDLLAAVDWGNVFCDAAGGADGCCAAPIDKPGCNVSIAGRCLPWLLDADDGCSDAFGPDPTTGLFYFSEMQWLAWLMYRNAARSPSIASMWGSWEGRATDPGYWYGGRPLLTLWPSYVTQLPYYLVKPFSTDPRFVALYRNQWEAEWYFYNESAYFAGDFGRYGLGAGTTPAWCTAGQATYKAELITNGSTSGCRIISGYALAGYLPANPPVVREHLLALIARGETVLPVMGSSGFVLWRKSLIDLDWRLGYGITLVDFAAELFGLATLWLKPGFFADYAY